MRDISVNVLVIIANDIAASAMQFVSQFQSFIYTFPYFKLVSWPGQRVTKTQSSTYSYKLPPLVLIFIHSLFSALNENTNGQAKAG